MWKFVSVAIGVLCIASQIPGCSWDYPVWRKNTASDTPLFRFVVNENTSGYINRAGKIIIPAQYWAFGNTENDFVEGVKAVRRKGESSFYIDAAGTRLKQFDSLHLGEFSEGLASASLGGKDGFVDHAGRFVIAAQFESAGAFHEGLALVKVGARYGYIDRSGALVIAAKFAAAQEFSNGRALVIENGPCTFVGYDPCAVFNPRVIPAVIPVPNSIVSPSRRCHYSVIDRKGTIIFSGSYIDAKKFTEGLAAMGDGRSWGYVDSAGKVRIPLQFDSAEPFSEGFAAVSLKGKAGFIDQSGTVLVPLLFASVGSFSEGLAVVVDQLGKHSFVDKTGKKAIPGTFDAASGFVLGLAHVRVGDTWSYIDRTGKAVFTYSERAQNAPQSRVKQASVR